jgi:hypothetical protein
MTVICLESYLNFLLLHILIHHLLEPWHWMWTNDLWSTMLMHKQGTKFVYWYKEDLIWCYFCLFLSRSMTLCDTVYTVQRRR